MKNWQKSLAFVILCSYTHQDLLEVGNHAVRRMGWINDPTTGAHPKQAWKSLRNLYCNHNSVGDCTYLTSKIVQINKNELMEPLRKVSQRVVY